jgi:hypothetical protein
MIDLSPDIFQTLEGNAEIIARVGHDQDGNSRIYQRNIPYPDLYPQITFFEITNFDSNYADDEAIESTVSYQVSIWTKLSDPELNTEVDAAMKSLGFRRTGSMDDYESDVEVYQKGLRYTMAVNAN